MREGTPVAGSHLRVGVGALALFEMVAGAVMSASGLGLASPGAPLAAGRDETAYPHLIGQEHVGRRCTHQDTMVAAGTIVGVGGQVVAGGGGTGVGCDTFYAYEIRSGQPSGRQPFVDPGYTLRPGPARV